MDVATPNRGRYRSVAFGTWKVGDARAMMAAKSTEDVARLVRQKRQESQPSLLLHSIGDGHQASLARSNPCLDRVMQPPCCCPNPSAMGPSLPPCHGMSTSLLMAAPGYGNAYPAHGEYTRTPSPRGHDSSPVLPPLSAPLNGARRDLFSSNEYVQYVGRRSSDRSENLSDASSSRHAARMATSLQRVHYRSASAGAEGSYRIQLEPTAMPNQKSPSRDRPGTLDERRTSDGPSNKVKRKDRGMFKGAKLFFKSLYSSATLPSKKASASTPSVRQEDIVERETLVKGYGTPLRMREDDGNHMYENLADLSYPSYLFPSCSSLSHHSVSLLEGGVYVHGGGYEAYPGPVLQHPSLASLASPAGCSTPVMNRVDEYRNELASMANSSPRSTVGGGTISGGEETAGMMPSYADSGVAGDESSSSPDESLLSVATKSDEEKEKEGWGDLFLHLKKELMLMKERDAQILADLHKVESQLQGVRLAQMHQQELE